MTLKLGGFLSGLLRPSEYSRRFYGVRSRGFRSSIATGLVLGVAVVSANPVVSFSADAGLSGVSIIEYTEGASAVPIFENLIVTGGPFDGQYIEFEADPNAAHAGNREDLVIPEVASLAAIDKTAGAVSVFDGAVYLGEGSTYSQIGQISAVYDGLNGTKLRVDFVTAFENSGFESAPVGTNLQTSTIEGWTARSGQVDLGTTVVRIGSQVYTIPEMSTYPDNVGSCFPNDDNNSASLTTSVKVVSGVTGGKNNFSEGSQGLELSSNGTSLAQGDVVHGPMVWSDEFTGENGQTLYFDWLAAAGGDNYHIWAALLRTDIAPGDSAWTEVLDRTGDSATASTNWATASVVIPSNGTYRFVFVSGTQDFTCGKGIGARLVIDKVQVVGSKATASAAQALARKVTYFNDADAPPVSPQIVRAVAKPTSGLAATLDTITVDIEPVNDAPSLDGDLATTAVARTVVETDASSEVNPLSDVTGTLDGYDPDLGSPSFTFGITGGTVSGSTVSKTGSYGTLTLTPATGAYTYEPNMAAIKPLDTGDDPVDSFAITVSDGLLSGSGTLNITIDGFTDTEPSAPTITAVIAGNGFLTVLFDAPGSPGANPLTGYEYSTDGTTFRAVGGVPTGGLTISTLSSDGSTRLVNGTSYPITIRATNGQLSPESNTFSGTPASTPSINTPTIQSFEPSAVLTEINQDFTVSGFGLTDTLLVSVGLSGQGTGTQFALPQFSISGVTIGSGFSSYTNNTAVSELAFTGTQTQVNAALRDLKLQTGAARSNFSVNVSASVASGSIVQSGSTQSFYEYVPDSGITFAKASDEAARRTFAGVNGYLVTITSEAENTFVKDRINGATNVWIGATDEAVEGVWRWVTGPEGANGGTEFWNETDGTVTYASWSGGEPNNAGAGEDAAVTNWDSATGTWNDLAFTNSSRVNGYVVEYSEWNGQSFSASRVIKTSSTVNMGGPQLTATAGSLSAQLSWTTPVRTGQTVASYAVTSVPSVTGVTVCSGTATSCTVTGLEAGTSYTFTVTATWSDSVTSTSNSASARAVAQLPASNGSSNSSRPTTPPPTSPVVTPRATNPTPPLPTPGGTNGPVLRGGVVPTPPAAPQVLVGGQPTNAATTASSNNRLDVQAGTLNLAVQVPEDRGGVSSAPNGASEISVQKGASANLQGSGLRPGSVVQVFLPLSGDNSRELTSIPVGPDGSFNGEAPFATRPQDPPLPIGRHVLQMVSLDQNGNQVVVEMTVNIAQGAPAPELNRIEGVIPSLVPGQSIATSGGEPVPVRITPIAEQRLAVVEGDGWSMAVNVNSEQGGVSPTEGGAVLTLVRNESAIISGEGFMPDTRADVWLFSDPTLLGTVTIDENGAFTGEFNIDPNMIPTGEHTLQMQGVGMDGYVKAANLGVLVDDSAAAEAPDAATTSLSFLWWVLAIFGGLAVAAGCWWFWTRRASRPVV